MAGTRKERDRHHDRAKAIEASKYTILGDQGHGRWGGEVEVKG